MQLEDGKDEIGGVPHNGNGDLVGIVDEETSPKMDGIGGVIDTPPCVLDDDGIGSNMVDDPLILNIVIR